MEFHLGSDVRDSEDKRLGELRRIVFDPETREVVSIVVQHAGLDEREVLVPMGAVNLANHDGVILDLGPDDFSRMDVFAEPRNLAPPPTADNLENDRELEPDDIADVPAVGAATGVESIAFIPILEEDTRVPAMDDVLDQEWTIRATDGEVGRLSDVRIDDQTRRIMAFFVEKGAIFKHEVEIPADAVASIADGVISLRIETSSVSQRRAG